jgi:hypothetical protein
MIRIFLKASRQKALTTNYRKIGKNYRLTGKTYR